MQVACKAACVQGKRSCKREGEMCLCQQSSVGMGMGVCMCASSINKSPVYSYLCVCECVCNGSADGSAIKELPKMCACVFVHT